MRIFLGLLPPALALVFLSSILDKAGFDSAALLAPGVLAFTLLVPLLAQAVTDSPEAPFRAIWAGLAREASTLPLAARERAAARLLSLAGTTLAMGVAAGLFGFVAAFNSVAASGGQASASILIANLGGTVLGPVYGLVFGGLFYATLAQRVTTRPPGLGETLDELAN